MVWRRYNRNKRQALEQTEDQDDDEDFEEEEILDREKRNTNERNRKTKNPRRTKNKFSSLDDDFNFGAETGNVYQDFYGGKHRLRSCQKRMLRVNFKDLNWQVSKLSRDLGGNL